MPFEIKRHTVPHLKGLNSGLEPSTRAWKQFHRPHALLKSAHFTSYGAKRAVCFALNCILFSISESALFFIIQTLVH